MNEPLGDQPVKKKRGRKPKIKEEIITDSISNNSLQSSVDTKNLLNNSVQSNIENPKVLHLNINDDLSENKIASYNSFEESFCEYDPKICEPNAYEENLMKYMMINKDSNLINQDKKTLSTNLINFVDEKKWPETTTSACHWCCHNFTNTPLGVPIKYLNGLFYCYGSYCSLECAAAHNFECNQMNIDVWESYNLINLLSKKISHILKVNCAPRKQCLKMFGGEMTIEEFRNMKNKNTFITCNTFPMVSITDNIEEINDYLYVNNDNQNTFSIKMDSVNKNESIIF